MYLVIISESEAHFSRVTQTLCPSSEGVSDPAVPPTSTVSTGPKKVSPLGPRDWFWNKTCFLDFVQTLHKPDKKLRDGQKRKRSSADGTAGAQSGK